MPDGNSRAMHRQVAIGSAFGFLVLAVVGFAFVSVTSGVVMLVLAVVWPPFYLMFFGGRDVRR